MAYLPNPGKLPPECQVTDPDTRRIRFKPVHVKLHNGFCTRAAGHPPWPSGGGYPPTDWRLRKPPHPFDIVEFEIA